MGETSRVRTLEAANPETAALAMQQLNLLLHPEAPPTFVCLQGDSALVTQAGEEPVRFVRRTRCP